MTVIITDATPPRIRGALKRWFIEPKPNCFVGTVNEKVCNELLDYLRQLDSRWNALVVVSVDNSQGFRLYSVGYPNKHIITIDGLQLIMQKVSCPF